jgi:YHS domain-containing protein
MLRRLERRIEMNRILAACICAAFALAAYAGDTQEADKPKPYPFDFCAVQWDEKLDPEAEPYAAVYKGQEYRFCCKDCRSEFLENPDVFAEKIEELLKRESAGD